MELFSALLLLSFILLGLFFHKSKIAEYGLLILLFILFAFEKSIGDYEGYLSMYDEIGKGVGRANEYEILYVLACSTAAKIGLSFDQMRYIFCVAEVLMIHGVIRKYTKNRALVLSLFMIYPALLDAELFRFLFGMSLVIYGLPYLLQGNQKGYLTYFVFVVLAALFHTSCWAFLIYFLLLIKKRRTLVIIVTVSLLLGTTLSAIDSVFKVMEYLPIREHVIEKYETDSYSNMTGILFDIVKQILIFSLGFLAYYCVNSRQLYYDCIVLRKKRKNRETRETREKALSLNKRNYVFVLGKNRKTRKTRKNALALNNRIIDLNIISCLMLIPMYLSTSSQRLVHVIVFYNFIAIANSSLTKKGRYSFIYAFLIAVILLVFLLFIEGTGTQYAFISHFTEGFIINLLDTI